MKTKRFELLLPPDAVAAIERMAEENRTSKASIILQAIGVMDVIDRRPDGHYVGTCTDRGALAQVILGAR